MLRAAVAVLACLCVARCSPAESYSLRSYTQNPKDITSILSSIEERLRVLDTISAVQSKQTRRLDYIQDKLDRVENTLTLKLERAQLAAERLEHRLHMLQTNVQASIKESSEKLDRSQMKIAELTRNLTGHIVNHKHLLEKVNGAYADTWHRSLVLESLMKEAMSLVNATRRELADGLRGLARRQRESRVNSVELETMISKHLHEKTHKIDLKMQEVLDTQKLFVDSCQQVQQDDPKPVADVLDKLIESLIKMKSSIFHELNKIQDNLSMHDNRAVKIMNAQVVPGAKIVHFHSARERSKRYGHLCAGKDQGRVIQFSDGTCRKLENAFRNTSHTILKENELRQLTEKFVSLTDRADAALLRLEAQIKNDAEEPMPESDVTAEADRLLQKLEAYDRDSTVESKEYYDLEEDESAYFDDDEKSDNMDVQLHMIHMSDTKKKSRTTTRRTPHRRHLHKHPYDRGPSIKNTNPSLA